MNRISCRGRAWCCACGLHILLRGKGCRTAAWATGELAEHALRPCDPSEGNAHGNVSLAGADRQLPYLALAVPGSGCYGSLRKGMRDWSVRPFTNQETPNPKTASASKMNSRGASALTDAGSRFERAARTTQDRITMPQAR